MKLDIGCGPVPRKGYEGVDAIAYPEVKWVLDIEGGWPEAWDNAVDEVWCSHYVEHCRDLVAFADKLHRVLRPGAKAIITHPYAHSNRAWQDPTHVRAINEVSWLYWDKTWRDANRIGHVMACNFSVSIQPIWHPDWVRPEITDEQRLNAMGHLLNVVDDLHVTLTKRA